MNKKIELTEVLSLKYLSKYVWSPDSKDLVYLLNDGGVTHAWVVSVEGSQKPSQITTAAKGVSAIEWSTNNELALVIDGNVFIYSDTYQLKQQITTEGGYRSKIAWSSNGRTLAFTNGKLLSFYDTKTCFVNKVKPLGEVFAGKFSQKVKNTSFAWSPDGSKFLYTYIDLNQKPYLALTNNEGQHIWTSTANSKLLGEAHWVTDSQLVYVLFGHLSVSRSYILATIPPTTEWQDYSHIGAVSKFIMHYEEILVLKVADKKGGMLSNVTPINENELLFGTESDGYFHYYKYNIIEKNLSQLTKGNWEDLGHLSGRASLSPAKSKFVFSSNKTHRTERQLFVYDLSTSSLEQLTHQSVTNVNPVWSPDGCKIAYFHADSQSNGELWVVDYETKTSTQLTDSMPEGLADKLQRPELITYQGAENWDIDAFLFKPANFDPHKKYPAIVWIHGGPRRQMRGSFHPSSAYSRYYALNQYLASNGYLVLSANFRGGIGYGSDFRHGLYLKKGVNDTIDIVNAGRYLKSLPYVNENKVAVYGISYGGYLTLHCLTKYPQEFVAGINIAGIWDRAQWDRWMKSEYGNYSGNTYMGGDIEERPDLWSEASPVTYKNNLCKPLLSLQGTGDMNVDFNQLNRLVKDLTALGAEHDAIYYPDEMHSFRWRHTWQDTLPRMVAFFDKHLKQ